MKIVEREVETINEFNMDNNIKIDRTLFDFLI